MYWGTIYTRNFGFKLTGKRLGLIKIDLYRRRKFYSTFWLGLSCSSFNHKFFGRSQIWTIQTRFRRLYQSSFCCSFGLQGSAILLFGFDSLCDIWFFYKYFNVAIDLFLFDSVSKLSISYKNIEQLALNHIVLTKDMFCVFIFSCDCSYLMIGYLWNGFVRQHM